jgi:UDP-2,3-diacylglucosamine pyrophosphatase LpxH
VDPERVFLIGDIVDLWSLKRRTYWPDTHQQVLDRLLKMAAEGRQVVLVPGNHDADLRVFSSSRLAGVEIRRNFVVRTGEGRRLLLIHGDEFDTQIGCQPWLRGLGSRLYDLTVGANVCVDRLRASLGYGYWSLAGYLKHKFASAKQHMHAFESAAIAEAKRRGVDGVLCGHIHRAALRESNGVLYGNDGDWVENCSAIIEDRTGQLRLWHWDANGAPISDRGVAACAY